MKLVVRKQNASTLSVQKSAQQCHAPEPSPSVLSFAKALSSLAMASVGRMKNLIL